MKYCSYCKADNPADAVYCHMCGKRIKKKNNISALLYISIFVMLVGLGMFIAGHAWIGVFSFLASILGMYIFAKKAD